MIDDKYIQQAAVLMSANFFVIGRGHFDVTATELSELLQILDNPDSLQKATEYYEGLQSDRNEKGEL